MQRSMVGSAPLVTMTPVCDGVDGAVGERAAAAVVAEPGAGGGLPDPAVVELRGRAVAHRDRRVAHLGEVAVDDVGARAAVEDEQRVRHVVHPAGVEDGASPRR